MKYLLPMTLAVAAAWGARPDPGDRASLPLAATLAPQTQGDPPWLSGDWPTSGEALGELDDDPHAGLYDADDPHAGLYLGGAADDASEDSSGVCPATGAGSPDALEATDADPHGAAVGRTALLAAGLEPRLVARSAAANGHSIAEIHARRAQLADHRVRVRATVVKRTDGILGKSYLHLWDGSATPEASDDDLTVTSTEEFQIGETIEVEGRLLLDQDLGIGYRYPVLLDGATRVAR